MAAFAYLCQKDVSADRVSPHASANVRGCSMLLPADP